MILPWRLPHKQAQTRPMTLVGPLHQALAVCAACRPLLEFYGKVKAPPLVCTPLGCHGALKLARKSSAWLWRP